jgi:DHA1 family bicyclomycin/chloramphenicol resistance-like MFS transporter
MSNNTIKKSFNVIIAPTLSGYITKAFGWRYVFAMLIVVVVLLMLTGTYFFFPESKKPDPNFSLKPAPIVRNFLAVLKHPHFIPYALARAIF